MNNQSHPWLIVNGELYQASPVMRWEHPPVYEVIRLINGMPLFFEGHMARLKESLRLMAYDTAIDATEILKKIIMLAEKNQVVNHNVRIEMGIDAEGNWRSVIFFVTTFYPDKHYYLSGIETVTTEIVRHNPHAKVINQDYLAHIGKVKIDSGAFEVLIMDTNHKLAEGSRSNLFFIKGETLYSARSEDILMGITRLKILDAAEKVGIALKEQDIYLEAISDFDACFISGTSIHILPIARVDSFDFASASNPVILKLTEAFEKMIEADLEKTRREYL